MSTRHLDSALLEHVSSRKEILVLLGARQVGKTTILQRLFPQAQYFSVDSEPVRKVLETFDPTIYRDRLTTGVKLVVLDELHLLSNPGRAAKIFHDLIPEVKLIITGSSAFNIKNKTEESLAGRKIDYHLYPLTISEYLFQKGIENSLDCPILGNLKFKKPIDNTGILDNILVYGLYPALISQPNDKAYLTNLAQSVIYRDLLDLSLIENRVAAQKLLKLLAYQIGSLVNFSELASKTGIDVKTVKRYLGLFEQSYLVFTLLPYSKRKGLELVKSPKVYFYDLGLRNALIEDFNSIGVRPDSGALWENFVVSEVVKANYYGNFGYKINFWRTSQGSEIDLVLEKGDKLWGIEVKSTSKRINMAFKNRYPNAKISVVSKENFF